MGGVVEVVDLGELVEEALKLHQAGFSRHGVEIVREFEPVEPVSIDKHKVLQILINLISNAQHAVKDSDETDKRITLRIAGTSDDSVRIEVQDNGTGISPENLTKIFSHGFSTKKDGHGFGLHSSALAAKELGGSLSVHSDGPGQGARFSLNLNSHVNEVVTCT